MRHTFGLARSRVHDSRQDSIPPEWIHTTYYDLIESYDERESDDEGESDDIE